MLDTIESINKNNVLKKVIISLYNIQNKINNVQAIKLISFTLLCNFDKNIWYVI